MNPTEKHCYSAPNPDPSPSEVICLVQCTSRSFADWLNDSPAEHDPIKLEYPHFSSVTAAEDETEAQAPDMLLQYPPSSTHNEQVSRPRSQCLLSTPRGVDTFYNPAATQIRQQPSLNCDSRIFPFHIETTLALPGPSTPISCKVTDRITPRTPASLASHFSISPLTFKYAPDFHHTPFGKHYELSTDWTISESYISPVLRASDLPSQTSFDPQDLHSRSMPIDDDRTRPPGVTGSSFLEKLRIVRPPPSDGPAVAKRVIPVQDHVTNLLYSPLHSPNKFSDISRTDNDAPSDALPFVLSPVLARTSKETINPLQRFETPAPLQEIFPLSPLTPLTPTFPITTPSPAVPACKAFGHLAQGNDLKKRRLSNPASPTPLPRLKKTRFNTRGLQNVDLLEAADYISSRRTDTQLELRMPLVTSRYASTADSVPLPSFINRTFPLDGTIEISPTFHLFYRRFPASSYFQPTCSESPCSLFRMQHPGGTYNAPRDILDLYTPRFVKGKGKEKVGICPICIENFERGGEDKRLWLAMKFSAFKCYHMQYGHGISAATARPFSPPTAFRFVPRPLPGRKEKSTIQEGMCHKCHKWVAVEGIKDMEVKVKEIFWWKHAAMCHQGSTIDGEQDIYEEDGVYQCLMQLEE